MSETKTRIGINWEEKLAGTEIGTRKEDGKEMRVVLLKGLQRLAQEAGLYKSHCQFTFISAVDTGGGFGILQAIYTAEFNDGSVWVGCADYNAKNTSGKFANYPTAVAESRAEARCLRKALNISILSSEEIGMNDASIEQIEASPTKPIDSQVVKAIEKLCETRDVSKAKLLEAILDQKRNNSVFELTDLTVEEGQKAMSWLNEQKQKAVKLTATQERDARKKELQKESS